MWRKLLLAAGLSFLNFPFGSLACGQGLGITGELVTHADGSSTFHVRTVLPLGLAGRLGVLPGDQILSINGFAPGNATVNQQAITMGGGAVSLVVVRGGLPIQLGTRPSRPSVPGYLDDRHDHDPLRLRRPPIGQPYRRPGPDLLVDLEETRDLSGIRVRVRSVTPGGRGAKEGLMVGDIIESVNGVKARSLRDIRDAYYFRNGQIVITYLRGSSVKQIRLTDRDSTRRTLGVTTVLTQKREVKVTGADPKGLGSELGIATRGTVILKVNGTPIQTPAALKRVDQAIIDGRITRLEIEFIPPGGKPQVVRRTL